MNSRAVRITVAALLFITMAACSVDKFSQESILMARRLTAAIDHELTPDFTLIATQSNPLECEYPFPGGPGFSTFFDPMMPPADAMAYARRKVEQLGWSGADESKPLPDSTLTVSYTMSTDAGEATLTLYEPDAVGPSGQPEFAYSVTAFSC